jgi:hypothetical protein
MFIFEITPDWLYHTIFFASLTSVLAGFFLAKVPFIKQYVLLLKWGGLLTLTLSLFLEGALYDYNVMQARIEETKKQVQEYEQQNKELNDKLAQKSEKTKEKIKVKKEYITKYIDREITKYDNTCVIPKEFVKAHNDAAEKSK